eukprot:TRINITY_DN1944_c1_g2_i1.p1 TRINITY_DN1944_c1_g2~~TRINITY_DN1944_c1_g2_i1.p1  ORF type:complete len:257 (+),score=35.17 TRINITY_DN1944_c1_g2_i1:123-893(+)
MALTPGADECFPSPLGQRDVAPPPGLALCGMYGPLTTGEPDDGKPNAQNMACGRCDESLKAPMFLNLALNQLTTESSYVAGDVNGKLGDQMDGQLVGPPVLNRAVRPSSLYVPGSVLLREANTASPLSSSRSTEAPGPCEALTTTSPSLSYQSTPLSTVTLHLDNHLETPTTTTCTPLSTTVLHLDGNLETPTSACCGTLSRGSMLHGQGLCKPCDFTRRGGCRAGIDCSFCHLCSPEDAKRKKKEKKRIVRQLRK